MPRKISPGKFSAVSTGDELPSSIEAFVDRHIGAERQLTLRLA
jgi:hypothetical protein